MVIGVVKCSADVEDNFGSHAKFSLLTGRCFSKIHIKITETSWFLTQKSSTPLSPTLLAFWACTVERIFAPYTSPLPHQYSFLLQEHNVPGNCGDNYQPRAATSRVDHSWDHFLVPAAVNPSDEGTYRNSVL